MESLRHLLPSSGALFVFEAAGRLGSFTAAAKELGMSQAAVSYAIKKLESQLGVQLFVRENRQVILSDAGERFFADVHLGLGQIRRSAQDLRTSLVGSHVTLSASTAFAAFWMMPRLQEFRDAVPSVELRLQTSERDIDLIIENVPLGLRAGQPSDWPQYDAALLVEEEIFAVASPAYIAAQKPANNIAALLTQRLIHLEEPFRQAPTWTDWLAHGDILSRPDSRGLRINDYALVLQATLEGQGVALGWRHLTERLLRVGLLERVTDRTMKTGRGFYVVWAKGRPLSQQATIARDWLLSHR